MGKNRCDNYVEAVVIHTKCTYDRPLVEVFGQDLNAALGTINFETNKSPQATVLSQVHYITSQPPSAHSSLLGKPERKSSQTCFALVLK